MRNFAAMFAAVFLAIVTSAAAISVFMMATYHKPTICDQYDAQPDNKKADYIASQITEDANWGHRFVEECMK